jgi:biotin transporter BioY
MGFLAIFFGFIAIAWVIEKIKQKFPEWQTNPLALICIMIVILVIIACVGLMLVAAATG